MASQNVYIVSAKRTPIGAINGSVASIPAHQLGGIVIKECLREAMEFAPDQVDEVIMGQVLTGAQGQNPVRQAAVLAGLPFAVPAWGVNMLCGSGLRAVINAFQAIRNGDANAIVAGGMESMSCAPHAMHLRTGVKFGDVTHVDTMIKDGLTDAFDGVHMGMTAENVAREWNVSREDQDLFALQSQLKCQQAIEAGCFQDEIVAVPVKSKTGTTQVVADEFPRPGCKIEALEKLRPCFLKDGSGTVTAGNASGINDGAAALLLLSEPEMKRRNIQPLARIVSWGQAGVDPTVMGTGPIPAIRKALKNAEWTAEEVDLFELNEAFAAQSLAVIQTLALDAAKVNVAGGAIALGHPIGASGARVLVTLIHAMARRKAHKGVAALCVGGGMGIAVCVQRD